MRKIVAELFVSLDGVVDMDEQSIEPYFNDEVIAVLQSSQAAADTILLGRRTYEEFAAYWADKTGADDRSPTTSTAPPSSSCQRP
ncbi:MAG TPA: dihydrofolate reductase family protein [Acidimicrobiales bacterium]|nr:dihydrofolate reductase family protein [Acidimicrobiales bacterium]